MKSFTLRKSRLWVQLLAAIHSLAAVACLANALPWIYKAVIFVAIGRSLLFYLHRYHTHSHCIRHNEDSSWSIATQDNNFQTVQILPSSVTTSWLIVLHFRPENGSRQNWLILNDALSEADYRLLVGTLKMAGLS